MDWWYAPALEGCAAVECEERVADGQQHSAATCSRHTTTVRPSIGRLAPGWRQCGIDLQLLGGVHLCYGLCLCSSLRHTMPGTTLL